MANYIMKNSGQDLDETITAYKNGTIAKAKVGLGNVDNTSDLNKPVSNAAQTALNAKADKQNDNGGFSAGVNSRAGSGAGIGSWAVAYSGGAVGKYAKAEYGGAVGHGTTTSDGFAGGYNAKTVDSNEKGIDAVQLGTGTNNTPKTLQVYDKRIVEADGSLSDVGKLSELNTTAKSTIVSAINELKASGDGGGAIGESAMTLTGGSVGLTAASSSGGAVGSNATTNDGGAVGAFSSSGDGFAGGKDASTVESADGAFLGDGGAIGNTATTQEGGSVGHLAYSDNGGAVGCMATTSDGFAGGYHAKAEDNDGVPIDAIQLGTGTNNTPKTLHVYNKRIVEADGSLSDVGKLSELNTAAKDTIVAAINELQTDNGLPAGTIIYYAASTPPYGYLKCDGSSVSRTTYSALFAVIGTTYGVGDGSTTFQLPDLRAEFLRGYDDGRGIDTDRAFGSSQEGTSFSTNGTGGRYVDNGEESFTGKAATSGSGSDSGKNNVNAIRVRPRNVAMLACIKY